jgi:hypothetical protein
MKNLLHTLSEKGMFGKCQHDIQETSLENVYDFIIAQNTLYPLTNY